MADAFLDLEEGKIFFIKLGLVAGSEPFIPSSTYTREVMTMVVTWELLILFCTFLVAVIKLVYDICNNKKR